MRSLYAAVAAASFVAYAQPAFAADNALDVNELTCERFTNYNDNNKG